MESDFEKFRGQLLMYSPDNGGFLAPLKNGARVDIVYKKEIRFSVIEFSEVSELPSGSKGIATASILLHANDDIAYYKSDSKHYILSGEQKVGEFIVD